ncbi:Mon2p KNAG_0K02360 [Huiozyma naganishii CBS 8797]|uniref:Protein MON2 n=1 Tax=Huiozyma naganishii (strain ATCC MYA-139 / BCRC 22969 / CBS 8797 / KCTC 17520 / NBRC 10181 / NCYC 3082 / Yp74L-3) TaxID=1071383 RepID=J7SAA9_HUIN7|nr:hypothetical protein KNAG_0K02360 [Kazachstania naganishii CBS 8797]CCK72599.1 hypothetical protein KNAG_0K02360 [Kazachstania naganishii CBS 8797]
MSSASATSAVAASGGSQFGILHKRLDADLHSLLSESKRKSSEVRHACEKSLKILRTVQSSDDLLRHPDFVVPLVLACASRNAKLTTISVQCLQGLASLNCIPRERLSEVLDAFIEATHLAIEIQLKILQIVPIFFKTYAQYLYGGLLAKLVLCCTNLFHLPTKSSIVTSTASAALQQLVDEIFERLSYQWDGKTADDMEQLGETFDVMVSNNDTIKVNTFRNDANQLFDNLISAMDTKRAAATQDATESAPHVPRILEVKEISLDYGLEVLESLLKNNRRAFLHYPDLQFLLRIKAIPLLLRCISTPKSFSLTVRAYRCIQLLLNKEYLEPMSLEIEVILSLLIHGISVGSNVPQWQRILSLEVFNEVSQDFNMIKSIYIMYDNSEEKKQVVTALLEECINVLQSPEVLPALARSKVIEKLEMPLISNETAVARTKFMFLLDKNHPPPVNVSYLIWLILSLSNSWSESLSNIAMDASSDMNENNNEEIDLRNSEVMGFYNGVFANLFHINETFLYSTALDTQIFHTLVRSFQKLGHGAGLLHLNDKLDQCLRVFSIAIVNNTTKSESTQIEENKRLSTSDKSGVLSSIGGSLIGLNEVNATNATTKKPSEKKSMHPRVLNSKHLSLFRAMVSLSVSLGAVFSPVNWNHIFITWQWVSYYIYGPSTDFMESYYSQDIPAQPNLSRNEINTVETGILKLLETTPLYSQPAFGTLITSLIESSNATLFDDFSYHPIDSNLEDAETEQQVEREIKLNYCIYNKSFYITQLSELSTFNYSRFWNGNGKDPWWHIMDYFVNLLGTRRISSTTLRLYIARIFNSIIKTISDEVGSIDDIDDRTKKFNMMENLIIGAMLKAIEEMSNLKIEKSDIYEGVVNTESEILLEILSTLKSILNEFGDLLTQSWLTVFKIINSPFELLNGSVDSLNVKETEDSSLLNAIVQKRTEMVQVSYEVFKLVSDDFLQTLPLEVIRYVIETLVHYVNQDKNLNISFSSISQFWLVGDYLRVRFEPEFKTETGKKLIEKVNQGQLMEIITSTDSDPYDFYNGLWTFLLKSLIECSNDKRIEVKKGALQTFFRIIDSHSNCLPSWDLIHSIVLKPLLTKNSQDENVAEYAEFFNVCISGLTNLYPTRFTTFQADPVCTEAWLTFLGFIERLLVSKSTGVKYVAINNYRELLKSMYLLDDVSTEILQKCEQLWNGYVIVYNDSIEQNNFIVKNEYDCVLELLNSFAELYQLMEKYHRVDFPFVENSLGLFTSAAKYPLLPQHTKDNNRPSSLQAAVLSGLTLFPSNKSNDIELLIIFQLSNMTTLMFDTREKILKKLASKLSNATLTRIPSFEAVSYLASKSLFERLDKIDDITLPISKEKHLLKVLKKIFLTLLEKPLIDLSKDNDTPMWVLCSRAFRILSTELFKPDVHPSLSSSIQEEFHNIFIEITSFPIKRINWATDSASEKNDLIEYNQFKEILLKEDVISYMNEEHLQHFISSVWSASFVYELDELEKAFIENKNLSEVTRRVCTVDLKEIFGSTVEPKLLSKTYCSQTCLNDLSKFITFEGQQFETLRKVSTQYVVSRIALCIRKYVSDENLVDRAPIPKVRKLELLTLLKGLLDIVLNLSREKIKDYAVEIDSLLLLHPLVLKMIPSSHKVVGLQKLVTEISLNFVTVMSTSQI